MLSPVIDRQSEFLAELRRLVNQGECLQLTTNYKGITLTQKITGISFDEYGICFNPLHQVSCNKPGQKLYIHHKSLAHAVETTISSIDLIAGSIRVSNFDCSDHPFQTRRRDRVQPGHPFRAILALPHISVSACVVDISEDGLGALYYQAHEIGTEFQPGQGLKVSLRLPNVFLSLTLTGRIIRTHRIRHSTMMSIGIQINPSEKQSNHLKTYIRTRQAEILDELSNAIRMVMDPVQTKDLYF